MKWKQTQLLKRIGAAALAAALAVTGLPAGTASVKAASKEIITNGAFDSDSSGWSTYNGGTIEYISDFGHTANGCLKVSGSKVNKDPASGVCIDLTGKLKAGATYQLKGSIYYQAGEGTDNTVANDTNSFNICFYYGTHYVDSNSIVVGARGGINKNEWGTIETTYTVPENADMSQVRIFIESCGWKPSYDDADLLTYYIDDFSLQKEGVPDPDEVIDPETQIKLEAGNTKTPGRHNPLIDYKFGADPYAMEYDGRVYVYMTNDSQQFEATPKDDKGYPTKENNYDKINTITVISSSDMVNWTNHGDIPVAGKNNPAGPAKWANNSWAPAVCHKEIDGKEQFFLYFADGGGGIGVLVADSPIGPFREPAGEGSSQLIKWGMQQSEGVVWLFDPAVLVDDDGTGYLYYGGGVPQGSENLPKTSRVVKLKDNMTELDGDAAVIEAPAIFEDSGIHKYNDTYYYTYCSNWNNTAGTGIANICVMTSDDPMGPFTYQGIAFENQNKFFGIGGNNHHCFFDFNGEHYFTYHAQTVTKSLGIPSGKQVYRSTHIQKVEYDTDDKTIQPIIGTYEGVDQTQNLNPYEKVEAETIGWAKGIVTETCTEPGSMVESINQKVTGITDGDYIAVSQADFGTDGAKSFTMKAKPLSGDSTVDIYLDAPDEKTGKKVGTINIPINDVTEKNLMEIDYWSFAKNEAKPKETSGDPYEPGAGEGWQEYTCNVTGATGVHDVYIVVSEGETVQTQKAAAVDSVIGKIGTVELSDACKAKIDAAREAYNNLSLAQREKVTGYETLTAAEAKYKELYNTQAAAPVITLIDEIGEVAYTEGCKDKIDAARSAYEKLTDAQQDFVTNYEDLEKAETKYSELKAAADKEAADAVIKAIQEIGTVTDSAECKARIDAARKAYGKLSDDQKKLVTNYSDLEKAEEDYKKLEASRPDPDPYQPGTNQPDTNQPDTNQPSANQPGTNQPSANQPDTNQPSANQPDANAPKEGETYTAGSYSYKVTSLANKTVSVVKMTKQSKAIKIGNTVNIEGVTFNITEIAKNAFKGNKKATSAKIGKNVTTIGESAFSGCSKLTKVTISSKVLSKIDKKAFYNCKKLKSLKISSSKIKTVGKQAFKGTAKKVKVDVPNNKAKAYKKLFQKQGLSKKATVK